MSNQPAIDYNHPLLKYLVIQLNNDIKKWMDRTKGDLSRDEYARGFKFGFGKERGWYIARLGITSPVIAGLVERLDYLVKDYTIQFIDDERILTLYFDDF
ncbi:MAG: hypothetical protein EBQ89_01605 [Alphaproteobacteria bacterium]|nr:hypothetical protein [Alphaproteobacteria bacterium]